MKLYFCPRCGRDYDGSQCIQDGSLRRCPMCGGTRVLLAGRVLVAAGAILLLISTLGIRPWVLVAGVLTGGSLCTLGLIRWLRERWVRERVAVAERDEDDWDEEDEEPEEDEDEDDGGFDDDLEDRRWR